MTNVKLFNRSAVILLASLMLFTSGCVSNIAGDKDSGETARLKRENALLKQQITRMRRQLQQSANRRKPVFRSRVSVVQFGANPVLGNEQATVALIEFSDYFCPFCSRFHNTTFDPIRQNYIDKGKLLYVYRDFPRGLAEQAVQAAIAANCAGEQGAYWRMQKKLFRHSPRINRAFYESTAKEMGLDVQKYKACLGSDLQRNKVTHDAAYGRSLGIRGTPTFYIGRVQGKKITASTKIVGAQPYAIFARTIESYLRPGSRP